MRRELRDLQRRLGTTMIFVTHDQEEAMSLADEIFLFNSGHIVQSGVPLDIYRRPRTRYAAEFFGKVNFIAVRPGAVRGGLRELRTENGICLLAPAGVALASASHALCALRPEAWRFAAADTETIPGRIIDAMHLGDRVEYRVETPIGTQLVTQLEGADLTDGDTVHLDPRPTFVHLIADDDGRSA